MLFVQDIAAPDQILVQQSDVDHHPYCHEGIDAALEFNEDVQIHPLPIDFNPPDDIISTVPEVVGYVAARHFLQGVVVKAVEPFIRDKAHNQVPHQFWGGE